MPADEQPFGDVEALREELDHFIRLSQVQAKQLSRYQELQQRIQQKQVQSAQLAGRFIN